VGSKINVVLPNGKTVAVDEETYNKLQGSKLVTRQSVEAEGAAREQREHDEKYSGAGATLKAAALGAADTLTFGAATTAAGVVGGEDFKNDLINSAKAHPVAHMAGAVGASLLPVGAGGIARNASKALGGGVAGRAVEGAIMGGVGEIATTNVTGDPVTIEGMALSMGVGGVLNVGFGAAADKVSSWGKKAASYADEGKTIKADVDTVKEARELFAKPMDSWDGFMESTKAAAKDADAAYKLAEKATKQYTNFAKGKPLRTEINKTEAAINRVSKYWSDPEVPAAVGSKAKQPISDEMKAKLKDWRDRLRKVDQLRSGGFDVDATQKAGRWVKNADIQPDHMKALEELRALREELKGFPAATRKSDWADLPPPPPTDVVPPESIRVPKSLREMADMTEGSIAKLNNLMQKDPRVAGEFAKLAKELDVDPSMGIAGIHAKLGKYMSAGKRLEALAAKEAADDGGDGMLSLLKRGANKFVRYGTARWADAALGGKWMGALGRVAAGEGVGLAMNATEDLISGSMMQSRLGLKNTIAGLIGKAAGPTAGGLKKLGPITAYLQADLLTGEKDKDADPEDFTAAAVKRIGNTFSVGATANDAAFLSVQSLMGHASDAAAKLANKVTGDIGYLMQVAPKDPGIATHLLSSDWKPSPEEAYTFAYQIEAVMNPLKAIERTIAGDGHPAAVEALWVRWPALMKTAAEEMAFALHDMTDVSYEKASHLSTLFRTPITGLSDPMISLELQGLYLPRSEAEPQNAAESWQRQGSGRPVGRPAAVQSSVAGSSVSGLLSQ